jgi:hypothetical protein
MIYVSILSIPEKKYFTISVKVLDLIEHFSSEKKRFLLQDYTYETLYSRSLLRDIGLISLRG